MAISSLSAWPFSGSSGALVSPYVKQSVFSSWAKKRLLDQKVKSQSMFLFVCTPLWHNDQLWSLISPLKMPLWSWSMITPPGSALLGRLFEPRAHLMPAGCRQGLEILGERHKGWKQNSFWWRGWIFLTFSFVWANYCQGCCQESHRTHLSRARESSCFQSFCPLPFEIHDFLQHAAVAVRRLEIWAEGEGWCQSTVAACKAAANYDSPH